jgi:hypothetical protein
MSARLASSQPAETPSNASLAKDIDNLESDIRVTTNKAKELDAETMVLLIGGSLWALYYIINLSVTFDFERLMLRLPGVVTKDEFRALCRLEMDVKNRESLLKFLRELYRLTRAYGLSTIFVPVEFSDDSETERPSDTLGA